MGCNCRGRAVRAQQNELVDVQTCNVVAGVTPSPGDAIRGNITVANQQSVQVTFDVRAELISQRTGEVVDQVTVEERASLPRSTNEQFFFAFRAPEINGDYDIRPAIINEQAEPSGPGSVF